MPGNDATAKPARAAMAAVATRPVIVWNGAQYAASSRELELELLRRDYGLDERMLQATLVPRYKRHRPQASARNVHVRRAASFRDTPTTTTTTATAAAAAAPSSDWILRQGNSSVSQINFHPWSELGERKFSHFDLVPWRRTRSALDLSSAVDYSASPSASPSASASAAAEKSLRELQKLELRHNRRRLQRSARSSTQQGLRRLVRVRLIFSIELRHKRMELLRQSALPMRVFEQRFALSENESAAYERILMDASAGVEQHVGYFSRRQAPREEGEGEEEQLVVDFASETEEEPEGEEAQYATIAATQENSAENVKEKTTKEEEKEKKENREKPVEIAAEDGAEMKEKRATTASKVPCVKCRDVAIKLR